MFRRVLPAIGARTSYLNWRSEPRELSAEFIFRCHGLQHGGPLVSSLVLGFLRVLLLPWELLLSWAPAVLGFLLAGGCAEVVSARLNPSHTWHHKCPASVCSSVLSRPQQGFEVTDIKALSASQLLGLGQTVLYLSDKSVLQLIRDHQRSL